MDMWGTEEGLNHFFPLKQNPTLPFYLDWLASELRGSPVSAPQCLGFRHIHHAGFLCGCQGFKHGFLCLCKNVRHLPTLHSSFKYIEKEMGLHFHPASCDDPATEVTSRSEAAFPPTALPSLIYCRQTGQENGTWGRVRLIHS